MVDFGAMKDKAQQFLKEHDDKLKGGIGKVGDFVGAKIGHDKVDGVENKLTEFIDKVAGTREDAAASPADPNDPLIPSTEGAAQPTSTNTPRSTTSQSTNPPSTTEPSTTEPSTTEPSTTAPSTTPQSTTPRRRPPRRRPPSHRPPRSRPPRRPPAARRRSLHRWPPSRRLGPSVEPPGPVPGSRSHGGQSRSAAIADRMRLAETGIAVRIG